MNFPKTKAEIAREFPIEKQLALFMDKCVWNCTIPAELPARLRMGRFMADKALYILTQETNARGALSALKAMSEVEGTLACIEDLLVELKTLGT